ncbi:hypothetical protein [Hymenobacter sp. BRD67]|uniref:hypothetical protein n=1 Tax=Hymenobacter sp. BRD67 TaxID=2675877 RepID=UPI001564E165|nr:hypothetical protein [Hymenobacter sp. BRD67]QKG53642.1 hypothetical protein GKZ67_14825 [Hymenobacter sp. BRD67]
MGKEERLMQEVIANPEMTTIQLTKSLYGANSINNQAAMRQLRARVQDKLLNHLYFLDHSDPRFVVSRRYEVECLDLLHKVTILCLEGEYSLSERLLRRCMRMALQGEFMGYAEQAGQRLLTIYAEQNLPYKYDALSKTLAKLREVIRYEQEAEELSLSVRLGMARAVAKRRAILLKMPAYLARAEELHKQGKTFITFLALYRIRIGNAELTGRYEDIVQYTTMATRLLQQGKLNARRFDQRFNQFMMVYAYLRTRQAAAGLKLAEAFAQEMHPTSSNWFYFYEHYLLLALHAGEYEQALQLLHLAHKNPSFTKLRPAALQRWELLEAYTEFIQPLEKLPVRRRNQLAVFAALTVPEYSRDKRGHNVAILVFQLLHFLRQRLLEPVLSRLERLRKYQQRHLRDAATLRSRTFLRLLLLLPEADFDPEVLGQRSKPLLAALKKAPW